MNLEHITDALAGQGGTAEPSQPDNSRDTYMDFRALEHALFSDDLGAAGEAFRRIQNDAPQISEALSRHPFPVDNRRLRALRELGQRLLIGDLDGAKQASTEFQY